MCDLLLIRHATTAVISHEIMGRAAGHPLDQHGKEQAQALADTLRHLPITAIYSSPMERTMETARPLAVSLGLELSILTGLQEIDFGEWTGQSFEQLNRQRRWQLFNTRRSQITIPGGEHMLDVQRRMILAIEEIANKHAGQTVAAFSHGDPIRSALCFYLGIPIDFMFRLEISPASCSLLHLTDELVILKYSNQSSVIQ